MAILVSGNTFTGGLTSVVINGTITATIHVLENTNEGVAIASADVPTGTTADVVVTAAGTFFATVVISAYTVDDALLVSTTPSTAQGTTASGASITTGSFTETAGGFVIATNSLAGAAGGSGTAISGFTTDALGGSGNKEYSGHLSPIVSTATGPVTSNWTTLQAGGLAVAAWR
ncbi:hypothetical protein [Bradyrhizobium erythrophlei]|nr:hypothetical protein [Bradyrhizobium erythrophlei]